jgi:hypothetical protein
MPVQAGSADRPALRDPRLFRGHHRHREVLYPRAETPPRRVAQTLVCMSASLVSLV